MKKSNKKIEKISKKVNKIFFFKNLKAVSQIVVTLWTYLENIREIGPKGEAQIENLSVPKKKIIIMITMKYARRGAHVKNPEELVSSIILNFFTYRKPLIR